MPDRPTSLAYVMSLNPLRLGPFPAAKTWIWGTVCILSTTHPILLNDLVLPYILYKWIIIVLPFLISICSSSDKTTVCMTRATYSDQGQSSGEHSMSAYIKISFNTWRNSVRSLPKLIVMQTVFVDTVLLRAFVVHSENKYQLKKISSNITKTCIIFGSSTYVSKW